jgi:hypothetical protein
MHCLCAEKINKGIDPKFLKKGLPQDMVPQALMERSSHSP